MRCLAVYLVPVPRQPSLSHVFLHGAFVASLTAAPAYSQWLGTPGTESFSGLGLSTAARSAGLAGAACALPDGAASIGVNPAGILGDEGRYRYSGSLRAHPAGADAGAVAYSRPAGDGAQFAVSAAYFDYGSEQEFDEQGNATGALLRPESFYPALTFAHSVGERWRLGASLKLAQEYLGDFQGSQFALGFGADLGVQYQPPARNLGFGIAVTNVGRKVTEHFTGDRNRGYFPGVARAGLFYHPRGMDKTVAVVDAELPFYEAPRASLGFEYRYSQHWGLRLGTRWDANDVNNVLNDIQAIHTHKRLGSALKAAIGTSLHLGGIDVDYAAQWWNGLGFVHAVTLAWTLGG